MGDKKKGHNNPKDFKAKQGMLGPSFQNPTEELPSFQPGETVVLKVAHTKSAKKQCHSEIWKRGEGASRHRWESKKSRVD